MKHSITLLCCLCLLACEPKVYFKKALPPDAEALTAIPFEFQGIYFSQCDSSIIHSLSNVIYVNSSFQFTTTLEQVQESESCSIQDGGFYLRGSKECAPFEYLSGDSIRVTIEQQDTMFHISDNQVAKLHKGRLFLNQQDKTGKWITSMVTPDEDGNLHWDLIDIPNKLDNVKEITRNFTTYKNQDDEDIFTINPTQIEFEELLTKEYLKECDVYIPFNFENPF